MSREHMPMLVRLAILAEILDDDLTVSEIARKYKVMPAAVRWIRRNGIPPTIATNILGIEHDVIMGMDAQSMAEKYHCALSMAYKLRRRARVESKEIGGDCEFGRMVREAAGRL